MSATVATAKLRSARCDRSDRPPRCLAFILIPPIFHRYSSHIVIPLISVPIVADGPRGGSLGPIDGSAGDSPGAVSFVHLRAAGFAAASGTRETFSPNPRRPPIFRAPACPTSQVNPISLADKDPRRMSKSSRIRSSIFGIAPRLAFLPSHCHSQA
jgi:hypothetical protein